MSNLSALSSCSGSTASLFSILEHDSYSENDCDEVDSDFIVISPVRLESTLNSTQEIKESSRPETSFRELKDEQQKVTPSENEPPESDAINVPNNDKNKLSPWETWLVRKLEQERLQQLDKARKAEKQRKRALEEKKLREEQQRNIEKKLEDQLKKAKLVKDKALAKKKSQIEKRKKVNEVKKQSASQKFQEWKLKKQEELIANKVIEKEKVSRMKDLTAQKSKLAQQAFNDWLFVKRLDMNKSLRSSRLFSTPKPAISLPPWRGQSDNDDLPLDFSTRLFLR